MLTPKIIPRKIDLAYQKQLEQEGIPSLISRIIAARPKHTHEKIQASFAPRLSYLSSPFGMKDLDKAVSRIILAIQDQEIIGIETDHDCDGQTAHAVIHTALIELFGVPENKIRSYIGHRMKEGYGLSDLVCERILQDSPRPSLIITADNGSADEPRIKKLLENNIDVIVTDHHEVPLDGPPKSAYACLNPTREDCGYGDPYIAGCMVAWLLMAGVYSELKKSNKLKINNLNNKNNAQDMASLLDFVAVGTVADCVSLSRSINNRAVVQAGLKIINAGARPCWQALRPLIKNPSITGSDCGFLIGPMLNSDGRLSDAFGSVNFLLAKNLTDAMPWARDLYDQNESRKKIQKKMTDQAVILAKEQVLLGRSSIVLFLLEGHAGVHGITASRIKDMFGRPVIIFSPKENLEKNTEELITGSARSIDELHIKQALDLASQELPEIVKKHGGHKGAAGIVISKSGFEQFSECFEKIILELVRLKNLENNLNILGPKILIDGELAAHEINLDLLDQIKNLEPFGREFEAPVFKIKARILNPKRVGDGTHLQCQLDLEGQRFSGIYFGGAADLLDPEIENLNHQEAELIVELADNYFRGRTLQFLIRVLI